MIFACILDWAQAKSAEVKIRWPNGEWQTLPDVAANQLITVKEGTGIVPPRTTQSSAPPT